MEQVGYLISLFLEILFSALINNLSAVVAFFAGLVVAVLSLLYTRRSWLLSKEASRAPAAFLEPFGTHDITDFFVALPFREGALFKFPFGCSFGSSLERTVHDAELLIELGDWLYRSHLERKLSNWARAREVKHGHDPVENTRLVRIYLKFGDLHPRVGYTWSESLFADRDTIVYATVEAETKDGVKVEIRTRSFLAAYVKLTLVGRDLPPVSKAVNLHLRRVESPANPDDLAASAMNILAEERALWAEGPAGRPLPERLAVVQFRNFKPILTAEDASLQALDRKPDYSTLIEVSEPVVHIFAAVLSR